LFLFERRNAKKDSTLAFVNSVKNTGGVFKVIALMVFTFAFDGTAVAEALALGEGAEALPACEPMFNVVSTIVSMSEDIRLVVKFAGVKIFSPLGEFSTGELNDMKLSRR
jgi:hypothetical protein